MRVGNNGGDGLVVARKIYSNGGKVTVFNLGDRLKYKGAAKQNFGIVEKIKIETINLQEISAVRDAVEVKYFPIHETPVLAFKSNAEAINTFIKAKSEFWAIIDSFYLSVSSSDIIEHQPNFLSDILVEVIEKNAELISDHWVKDVIINQKEFLEALPRGIEERLKTFRFS